MYSVRFHRVRAAHWRLICNNESAFLAVIMTRRSELAVVAEPPLVVAIVSRHLGMRREAIGGTMWQSPAGVGRCTMVCFILLVSNTSKRTGADFCRGLSAFLC
jgi:hypothetical protein